MTASEARFPFAGMLLEHPLMNAAGTCRTVEDVRRFARSAVSAVVVGSVTVDARDGNAGDVYWPEPTGSLNALGMPNRGLLFYASHLPEMTRIAREAGKPFILSVAGFTPEEYGTLASLGGSHGCDAVELNLGCPNVWAGATQKRIISFDPQAIQTVLETVVARMQPGCPVGVKLSPYSDPGLLAEVAAVLAGQPIAYVATSNTFPNAFAVKPSGRPLLTAGFGGLSGPAMKPVGLGQVAQFRALLPSHIDLVGVGGISVGQDISEYLAAGASAVQAATVFWNAHENPAVYSDLIQGFA